MCPSSLIHTAETPTGDGGSFLEKVELSRCIMALYRPKFASSLSLPRHVIAIFLMGVRRGWIRPGTLAIVVHGNKKGPGRANRFPSSLLTLPRPPTSTLARVVLPSTKFVLPCLSAHGPEADGGESLRRDSGHVRRIYSCERARARRRVAYDRPRAHLRPSFRVFEFCRFSTRYAAPPFPFSPPRSPSCPPPLLIHVSLVAVARVVSVVVDLCATSPWHPLSLSHRNLPNEIPFKPSSSHPLAHPPAARSMEIRTRAWLIEESRASDVVSCAASTRHASAPPVNISPSLIPSVTSNGLPSRA